MLILVVIVGILLSILVNGLADNLPAGLYRHPGDLLPRCQYCGEVRQVSDWDAMLSILLLGGGCRRCGAPRRFRDYAVELILGIGVPFLWIVNFHGSHSFPVDIAVLSGFLLMALIDLEHRVVLVEWIILLSAAILLLKLPAGGTTIISALEGAGAGLLVFLLLYLLGWILSWVFRIGGGIEPLGLGDVILAGVIGLATGWPSVLMALFISVFLGGLIGVAMLVWNLLRRRPLTGVTMAYGPYLLLAGVLVYFAGGPIISSLLAIP